jgi:hypothetical protein
MFDSVDGLLVVSGFKLDERAKSDEGTRYWIGTWAIYELSELGDWEKLAQGREAGDFNDQYAAEDAAREIGIHKARQMSQRK